MSRSEIIQTLKKFKKENAEDYGILLLGVFGSTARDEVNDASDVDIVVTMKKQDLFNLIGIKQDLEELLKVPVDVVSYRENMNSFLKGRIEKEARYV